MNYTFNIENAQKYGVDEAIMLYNFIFWIRKNKANGHNLHEIEIEDKKVLRTWTYNTLDAFTRLYPFWNRDKIFRIIRSLVKQKILVKGNFNKKKYDNTCWYAVVDESPLQICNADIAEMQCRDGKNAMPIPDLKPDKKTDKMEYAPDVFLTEAEYGRLIKDYHKKDVDSIIEDLSNALGNKIPKTKYKDHNKTVRNWLKIAKIKKREPDTICPDCKKPYKGSCCQACGWSE